MNGAKSNQPLKLGLRVGDVVEVRGIDEILPTLDENGALDALPFMPEMIKFCGKQFRVYKRVDKTCDTIIRDGIRSMKNTVLLEGLRCDGAEHGGCQAECMIFWKEGWLKRPSKQVANNRQTPKSNSAGTCAVEALYAKTKRAVDEATQETVYSCQATEMRKATTPLSPWRLSQYFRDVWSGNVSIFVILKGLFIWLFNLAQSLRKGAYHPYIEGKLKKTPQIKLDLQPGELVRVLPKAEILKTLDWRNRNRGLTFDREMVRYCGGTYRVHKRVKKLLDEKTGKMMALPADCIILEGVICTGELNRFCPRAIFPYWKETWLRRVDEH
jgi:hypothetical protein